MSEKVNSKMIQCADDMIGRNLSYFERKNIKKFIISRQVSIDSIFWNNGALSWALSSFDKATTPNNRRLLSRRHRMNMVDNTLYFYANYDSISNDMKHSVYSFLDSHDRDSEGSVMYRKGQSSAFLDTIGMISPFLVRYGKEFNNSDAVELGLMQFRAFFKNGMDDSSGLPYHGYDVEAQEKRGIIGWGRGLGWLMLGLSESLGWLDTTSDNYREVKGFLVNTADSILKFLRDDGSFSWQLQAIEGHSDTSVSGMIGYSLAHYSRITGDTRYESSVARIEEYLRDNIGGNGSVLNSSAECGGFSVYPQIYESNSWGQGFAILFLLELEKK